MYLTEDNAITTSCSLIQFPLEQILLTFPMINYRSVPTLNDDLHLKFKIIKTSFVWHKKYLVEVVAKLPAGREVWSLKITQCKRSQENKCKVAYFES